MKCNVCGCELPEGAAVCRICGSPAEPDVKPAVHKAAARPVDEIDFSWNTYDFPKPREPEDIHMDWPEFNVHHRLDSDTANKQIEVAMANSRPVSIMRGDAQEGFVSQPSARGGYNRNVTEPFEGFVDHSAQQKAAAAVNQVKSQTVPSVPPVPQNPWAYTPAPAYTVRQNPQPVPFVQPQVQQSFGSVWAMPVQQAMPSEPLWYTQPVPPVQVVPVQPVPVQSVPVHPVAAPNMQMPLQYTAPIPVYQPQAAPAPVPVCQPVQAAPSVGSAFQQPQTSSAAAPLYQQPQTVSASEKEPFVPPRRQSVSDDFLKPVFASDDEAVDDDWLRAQFSFGEDTAGRTIRTSRNSDDILKDRMRIDETRLFSELLSDEPGGEHPVHLPSASRTDRTTHVTAMPVSRLFSEADTAEETAGVKPVRIPMEPVFPKAQQPQTPVAVSEPALAGSEPSAAASESSAAVSEPSAAASESSAAVSEPSAAVSEPSVSVSASSDAGDRHMRFYTFNKKNEEFQALLDAEYARARAASMAEQSARNAVASQTVSTLASDRYQTTEKPAEENPRLTLEDLVSTDPSVGAGDTRVWSSSHVDEVQAAEEIPSPELFAEKPEEEMSSFDSMLTEGTKEYDAGSDETLAISLSKVRSASGTVRPLAEDVCIPPFADESAADRPSDTDGPLQDSSAAAEELPEEKTASASPFAGGDVPEVSIAMGSEAFSENTISVRLDEMRREEAQQKEQRSLRKQRLEEMAKARENLYGPGLSETNAEKKTESAAASVKPDRKKTKKKEEKKTEKRSSFDYSKEDYNKKTSPLVVLLIIIAVVAAIFEGALLLLNRFAPDLLITSYMREIENAVIKWALSFYETVMKGLGALFSR